MEQNRTTPFKNRIDKQLKRAQNGEMEESDRRQEDYWRNHPNSFGHSGWLRNQQRAEVLSKKAQKCTLKKKIHTVICQNAI